jgi:hypothetical protein
MEEGVSPFDNRLVPQEKKGECSSNRSDDSENGEPQPRLDGIEIPQVPPQPQPPEIRLRKVHRESNTEHSQQLKEGKEETAKEMKSLLSSTMRKVA